MLESLKTYLQFGNIYCGIEHSYDGNDFKVFATLLKKQNDRVKSEGRFEATNIEEIVKYIPQKQHVFLIVNDKDVLTKLVESGEVDNIKLVLKAYPNINLDEFYTEVLSQGNRHFISLCRKRIVDDMIEQYKSLGVSIINFSLGNLLAVTAQEFIANSQINTSNAHLTFEDNSLHTIQSIPEVGTITYDVNGLETDSTHLLSLVGALDSIIHQNGSQNNFSGEVEKLQKEHRLTQYFNFGVKFSGVVFLLILLTNFTIFSHYYKQVAQLKQELKTNHSTIDQMTQLSTKVKNAQNMVEKVLKTSHSKSSFYTDAIVRCQPKTILLNKLEYQPLRKPVSKNKAIDLDVNIIAISGESTSSDSFSKWLMDLEVLSWTDHINIVDYRDLSSDKSAFQIKIEMNEY